MESKKGFTLVELLAVIAILAILVIIALPNVINMYNRARKSAFLTEAQNVLKTTTNKVIEEGVSGKKINVVSNTKNPLNLTGEKINYNVKLDNQGKIKDYVISNDNFCISSKKEYDKLTIDDVSEDCSDIDLVDIAGTLMNKFYEKSGRTDRSLVYSIEFYSDGRVLDGEKYDVSEEEDGSITMYVKFSSENSAFLDLIIVADGKISFPEDSSKLFSFYYYNTCYGPQSNLKKILFNSSIDTSKAVDMREMFMWDQKLEELNLNNFDTSNVTNMSSMFRSAGATEIKGLTNFNTSKVTDMSDMFNATQAKALDISNFDTSNVTTMQRMFSNAQVTTLDLSSFNTSNVTNMEDMFVSAGATEIKGLTNFNTSKVTDMSGMFSYSKAETLDLRSFDTSNVTDMWGMFSGIVAKIIDLSSFNTSKVTNMYAMFSYSKIETLDLSSFDISNVTDVTRMFDYSDATTVYVKDDAVIDKFKNTYVPSTLTFVVKSK